MVFFVSSHPNQRCYNEHADLNPGFRQHPGSIFEGRGVKTKFSDVDRAKTTPKGNGMRNLLEPNAGTKKGANEAVPACWSSRWHWHPSSRLYALRALLEIRLLFRAKEDRRNRIAQR